MTEPGFFTGFGVGVLLMTFYVIYFLGDAEMRRHPILGRWYFPGMLTLIGIGIIVASHLLR